MKALLATIIAAATMLAANQPLTPAQLADSLTFAQNVWHGEADGAIELRLAPLNPCNLGKHDLIASTEVAWSESTIHFEGELPAEDAPADTHETTQTVRARRYIISINSNCDWSKLNLDNVMLHEYGHVLIGVESAWHSKDPRSIMFWIVNGEQSILAGDRAKIVQRVAVK